MANQDLNNTDPNLEDILGEDQTELTEEPEVTETPKKSVEPPEKPEVSEESKKTEKPEDKDTKTAAFFQDKYQKAMATLKEKAPAVYEEVTGKPVVEKKVDVSTKVAPDTRGYENLWDDINPADVKRISEEGLNAADIAKITKQAAKDATREALAERDGSRTYENELRDANKICSEYAESIGATDEQIAAAKRELDSYGVDGRRLGGPTTKARILIKELDSIMRETHVQGRVTDAERIATEKARKLKSTLQPGGGGAPTPGEKSSQRQKLERMDAIPDRTLDDILKG